MLDDLIRSLPRGLFAAIAIGLGIGLILLLNPMHTPCMSQNNLLVEDLSPLFFTKPNPKLQNRKPPSLYTKYRETCIKGTSQGACLRWFEALNRLDKALVNSPSECVGEALELKEISDAVKEAIEMMVRLAWGAKAPATHYEKNNWLDSFHLDTFCNFKTWYTNAKGKEAWEGLREDLLAQLPGSDGLTREQIWQRSILSTSCRAIQR